MDESKFLSTVSKRILNGQIKRLEEAPSLLVRPLSLGNLNPSSLGAVAPAASPLRTHNAFALPPPFTLRRPTTAVEDEPPPLGRPERAVGLQRRLQLRLSL